MFDDILPCHYIVIDRGVLFTSKRLIQNPSRPDLIAYLPRQNVIIYNIVIKRPSAVCSRITINDAQVLSTYNRLCYCRGTARRATSVEIL